MKLQCNTFDEYIDRLSKLTPVDILAPERQDILKKAFDNDWSLDIALELIQICWIRSWEDGDNDATMDMVIESFERAYGKS